MIKLNKNKHFVTRVTFEKNWKMIPTLCVNLLKQILSKIRSKYIFFWIPTLCFEFLSTYICELRQQYSIVVWLSKNKKRSPLHLSRTGHLPATRWMNSAKLRSKVLQKLRYPYTAVIILKGNVKKSTLMQKTRNLWRH